MNRRSAIAMGLVVIGSAFAANAPILSAAEAGFVTLLEGAKGMENFNQIGNANWRVMDDSIGANLGNGFLVTKQSYQDFQLRAEVWVDTPANSGIFIRAENPQNVGGGSSYEVNIFDTRPGAEYATGAIVNIAKVIGAPKAGGKWNVMEIVAKGPQMTITFNGVKSAEGSDTKHPRGRIALQYGGGLVKFRKVEIKAL